MVVFVIVVCGVLHFCTELAKWCYSNFCIDSDGQSWIGLQSWTNGGFEENIGVFVCFLYFCVCLLFSAKKREKIIEAILSCTSVYIVLLSLLGSVIVCLDQSFARRSKSRPILSHVSRFVVLSHFASFFFESPVPFCSALSCRIRFRPVSHHSVTWT